MQCISPGRGWEGGADAPSAEDAACLEAAVELAEGAEGRAVPKGEATPLPFPPPGGGVQSST